MSGTFQPIPRQPGASLPTTPVHRSPHAAQGHRHPKSISKFSPTAPGASTFVPPYATAMDWPKLNPEPPAYYHDPRAQPPPNGLSGPAGANGPNGPNGPNPTAGPPPWALFGALPPGQMGPGQMMPQMGQMAPGPGPGLPYGASPGLVPQQPGMVPQVPPHTAYGHIPSPGAGQGLGPVPSQSPPGTGPATGPATGPGRRRRASNTRSNSGTPTAAPNAPTDRGGKSSTSSSPTSGSSPTSTPTCSTRSSSKRSRMGCMTCRQRKKRCCESRPKCTECSRLRLNCVWPVPGTEHKNKLKELKDEENVIHHEIYGRIKVLRGIVEYKSDEDPSVA